MIIDNEMRLTFPSRSCNEAFARVAVAAFATQLDLTVEEMSDIKTAVSEAVTNCIVHGYGDAIGDVNIYCVISGAHIIIKITDYGIGIPDIAKAREPLYTTAPEAERSGMGFTVMETFMDCVDVESQVGRGTEVTLTKDISSKSKTGTFDAS